MTTANPDNQVNPESMPFANPAAQIAGVSGTIAGTTDNPVIAAQGAGVRVNLTTIVVCNAHATQGTWVNIKSGATVVFTGYAAPLGGGFSVSFPSALLGSLNAAWNVACESTASVRASLVGFSVNG